MDYKDIVRVNKNVKEKLITKKDDLLVCARNGSARLIGKNAILHEADANQTFGAFMMVFRSDKNHFVHQLLNTRRYTSQVSENLGARINQITSSDLSSFEFFFPTENSEMNKIAALLDLLDERIVTQSKIIEDLKKLKSAIIENHYNQTEKQTVSIADLGEPFSVGNLAKDDLTETGMPCVIYGELFTTYGETISQIESHTNKTTGMILSKKGDLLFPSSTTVDAMSLIAPSVINVDGVILGGDMFGIHINHNYNAQYLSYYFNHIAKRQLAKFAKGSTIIHLHYADLEKAKLLLPSLKEQNRMAKCLVALDKKVSVEQNLLSSLTCQKSYLLQQMFI
jgi:type I restriction enzyme S subunit